jgi:hypothetical protein
MPSQHWQMFAYDFVYFFFVFVMKGAQAVQLI